MHLLYIHQHFSTNAGSTGTRSYDYARHLVRLGHKVTMLTGVYALGPFGRDMPRGLVQRRTVDGIDVVIVNVPYANQMSYVRRIGSFLLFSMLSIIVALRQKGVESVTIFYRRSRREMPVFKEEIESALAGKKSAKQALDDAVSRGNQMLRQFERTVSR